MKVNISGDEAGSQTCSGEDGLTSRREEVMINVEMFTLINV